MTTTRRSGLIGDDRDQQAEWGGSPTDEAHDGTRGSVGTAVDDLGGGLPPPPTGVPEMIAISPPAGDRWFGHFLRLLGVGWLVGLSMFLIVGFFWLAYIFNRTGHRRRDLLWLLVPVVGAVLEYRALWRYTARSAYWTPRTDRPSDLLRGWQRPWAIGAGWVLGVLAFTLFAFVSAVGDEPAGDAFAGGVYRSDEGGFEVAFPVTPSRSVTTDQTGGLTIEMTSYLAESGGISYFLGYVDLPEGAPFSFAGGLDGMVQTLDEAVVTSRSRTSVAGFEALRATVVHSGGHLETLIVRTSDRYYFLGADSEADSDEAAEFIDSFDLTTGEQPTTTLPPLPAPSNLVLQVEPGSCSQAECRLVPTWTDNSTGETQFKFYEQYAGLVETVPSVTSETRGVVEGSRPGAVTPVGVPLCVWVTAVAPSGDESAASNRVCFTLSPSSTGDLR